MNSLYAPESFVSFDLYQLIMLADATAKTMRILKDSIFRPAVPQENGATTLNCEKVYIDGTLFVESKLFIGAVKVCAVLSNGSLFSKERL